MDFPTIFNNMAFPLAACIAMGWYVKYTTDNFNKERKDIMQQHKDAEESIREAINNNTIVMTKLCERMGEHDNTAND